MELHCFAPYLLKLITGLGNDLLRNWNYSTENFQINNFNISLIDIIKVRILNDLIGGINFIIILNRNSVMDLC